MHRLLRAGHSQWENVNQSIEKKMKKEGCAGGRRKRHNQKENNIMDWRNKLNKKADWERCRLKEEKKHWREAGKGENKATINGSSFYFFTAILILHVAFKTVHSASFDCCMPSLPFLFMLRSCLCLCFMQNTLVFESEVHSLLKLWHITSEV